MAGRRLTPGKRRQAEKKFERQAPRFERPEVTLARTRELIERERKR